MRDLKIFLVVVFFTLLTYWGVEPFAHSQMHKHVEGNNFTYSDLADVKSGGDASRGAELVMGAAACIGCHSIEAAGMPAPMDALSNSGAYGVTPPDLSSAGAIYDEKFLADLIKNPAHALKVEHKFTPESGRMHPMSQFYGAGGDIDSEVADIVAYLKSIAPADISPKQAYADACGRCHENRYGKVTQLGDTPTFKTQKDTLAYRVNVLEYQDNLKKYMGKLPPDLSIIIRARGHHFLETFVENPQSQLPGTSMPRVGLTEEGFEKVIEYLEFTGDNKKADRESLGVKVLIYTIIFALFAFLWKQSVWRKLH